MKARKYGSDKIEEFNAEDVTYLVINRLESIIHLKNGDTKRVQTVDIYNLLHSMTKVFHFDYYVPVYLNVKEIQSYKIIKTIVNIKFKNGEEITGISKYFFENFVIPKLKIQNNNKFDDKEK